MNPWDVLALTLIGAEVVLIVLILIACFFIIRAVNKKEKVKRLEQKKADLPTPHFSSLEVGDKFTVAYQAWQVDSIETEFDNLHVRHKVRITAHSVEEKN